MKESGNIAYKVSIVTIIGNLILTVFKLVAGFVGNSAAMLSDAIHSASDVLSTIIVIVGVKFAGKEADDAHQYGHERLECIAAIFLAAMLCATGFGIGYAGIKNIFYPTAPLTPPGNIALIAAVVSILLKEWMYWYTKAAADKINSGALLADAWHHRSDALSSIGSFIGIGGAIMGYPILDPIASVVICIMIIKASYSIAIDAVDKVTDKAVDAETLETIKELIARQKGVCQVDLVKSRQFGAKFYIDVEISCDGSLTLDQAHDIAENVHDKIEEGFPQLKHCMVHVNPIRPNHQCKLRH